MLRRAKSQELFHTRKQRKRAPSNMFLNKATHLAPSSPPETPDPTKRIPFSLNAVVRLCESWYSELPPSMMISPCNFKRVIEDLKMAAQ